jgi:hypothetical protein
MADQENPPSPGAWYETDKVENGQKVIGVKFPVLDKSALFEVLHEAGHFKGAIAQLRESFMDAPPGRPIFLPESTVDAVKSKFSINPENNGALYKTELDAHRAVEKTRAASASSSPGGNR